jgi:HEAT repeat protein
MKRCVILLAFACSLAGPGAASAQSRAPFEDQLANLKSPSAGTRQQAANALGRSRRREAVAPLAALVRDPEPKVRLEVVRALRELRELSAVPALVTAMKDETPQIREEAIGTLVEIYAERERSGAVAGFLEIFSDEYDRSSVQPFANVDPSVYAALAEALRDEDRDIRRSAAYAIGILDGGSVVRELVAALQDLDPEVRGAAATSIGKVGTAEDGKAIVVLLSDESASVRNRALQAIGVLKVREAGPALREMYEANRRKDLGVRVLACLSRIGDPAQAELFQQLVQDPDPDTRRLAVEGLGRVADRGRLEGLKKDFQRERNDELRLSYAFALTLLGDRAFLDTIVLSLSSRTLGRRSRDYLLEMGRGILPDLYPYLNDPDATVRAELCDIIGASGDPAAIEKLTPLVGDPSTKVADRANRAVERLRRRAGGS